MTQYNAQTNLEAASVINGSYNFLKRSYENFYKSSLRVMWSMIRKIPNSVMGISICNKVKSF